MFWKYAFMNKLGTLFIPGIIIAVGVGIYVFKCFGKHAQGMIELILFWLALCLAVYVLALLLTGISHLT